MSHDPLPFPFTVDGPEHLHRIYAQRRASCPFGTVVTPAGDSATLLVRAEDVQAALADPRLAHNLTAPGSPRIHPASSFRQDPRLMTNMDGEEHLRLRRIVAAAFTPRAVARWLPVIEEIADDLCDELLAAGAAADLMAGYCARLPLEIICRLLGVPPEDTARFRDWSTAFLSAAPITSEQRARKVAEFTRYVTELVAAHRAAPGDALIDVLVAARDGSDRLTEPELVMMVLGLIAVGNEATSNSLARAIRTLLRDDRALWLHLIDSPADLPPAIDELLRFSPPGGMFAMRQATTKVELPSGALAEGDAVIVATESALRDPRLYPDPDAVRFDRERPPYIVFGGGPHFCLGAHLARAEMAAGIGTLIRRVPTIRLAVAADAVRFSNGDILSAPTALPVTW